MSNSQNSPVSRTPSPAFSPLHVKEKKAVVQVPQAPLGQANPNPIIPGQQVDPAHDHTSVGGGVYEKGLGQKALLAKRFAKASKSTVSPTDSMQSPCSAKLTSAKKRHFQKGKPVSLQASFVAMQSPARSNAGGGDSEQQANPMRD